MSAQHELERTAADIPTPLDLDGSAARAYIGIPPGGGWRVYYGLDGGRRREYVGPNFDQSGASPAHQLCRYLNQRAGQ